MLPRRSRTRQPRRASGSVAASPDGFLRVDSSADAQGGGDLQVAFAAAMAALSPFEAAPHLAVAVSGGADSLALCLLAHAWAIAREGRVTAFTVDHQLRADSAAEAGQVGHWLAARGIEHGILPWSGTKPATGIQAAARCARYRLLDQACGAAGVLHLLVAHHAGDQAETLLMRTMAASGVYGLAAMQPVVTLPHCRLLRPLLAVDPGRLRRYLRTVDQPWIEDPSNRSAVYARVRVRQALPSLAATGLDAAALTQIASTMQEARDATDLAVVGWLATAVVVHAAGYAEVDMGRLRAAPRFLASQAVARLLAVIGGGRWEPEGAAVDRLLDLVVRGEGRSAATLARCRLIVRGDSLLVCRERRNLPAPVSVPAGGDVHWDGRFLIRIRVSGLPRAPAPQLRAVGPPPLGIDEASSANVGGVPKLVWPTLPALVDDDGLAQIPHLGYTRASPGCHAQIARVTFLTRRSLSDRDSFIV